MTDATSPANLIAERNAALDRAERAEKALAVALRTLRKVDELTTFVQACDAALDAIETEADRENREMIDELEAEATRLRDSLRPFGAYAARIDTRHDTRGHHDACPVALVPIADPEKAIINLGHCRRARALTGGDHG